MSEIHRTAGDLNVSLKGLFISKAGWGNSQDGKHRVISL